MSGWRWTILVSLLDYSGWVTETQWKQWPMVQSRLTERLTISYSWGISVALYKHRKEQRWILVNSKQLMIIPPKMSLWRNTESLLFILSTTKWSWLVSESRQAVVSSQQGETTIKRFFKCYSFAGAAHAPSTSALLRYKDRPDPKSWERHKYLNSSCHK